MISRMTPLMNLYPFSFDYLLSGYLPYLLFAILAIAIGVFVLHRVFRLKPLVGVATEKDAPEQKEPAASDQALSSFNFQKLKTNLDELKAGQNTLIEHLASVQTVLQRIQVDLYNLKQNKGAKTHHNPESHNYKTQRNPPAQFSQATNHRESANASDMTELYNASRTDQSSRAKFREKYKPFCINVANDVDRRRNANLAPDFRKEDDGSYLAVSQETDQAVVFPNFTLIVVDAVYGPGALSEVFECDSFDRRFSYPYIRVATPATFSSTGGQSWRVIHKGTLELGPGQDD